jgi:hypothetical protein
MMPATPPTMAQNRVQRRSFAAFLSSSATQSSTKSRGISKGAFEAANERTAAYASRHQLELDVFEAAPL